MDEGKFVVVCTYEKRDVDVYLCYTELEAQKKMLCIVADDYTFATEALGFESRFEISDDIKSATLTNTPPGEKSTTFFYRIGKVIE